MKRVILILFLVVNLQAGVWSSLSSSGFQGAYQSLNNMVEIRNQKIQNFWENEINPLIKEISKETKEKEKKLSILKELEKDLLLTEKNIQFYLNQKKELLGNEANIISEKGR
ncbi:hypothetical protein FQW77_08555 [Campylobacter jejuni]|nr:hypothetical protein [Campylobacter jejuni]